MQKETSVPADRWMPPEAVAPARQWTVLIVDDDEDLRALAAEPLIQAGFQVVVAGDGPSMFAALGRQAVDLIVLDLNLPGQDGLSLCRLSRSRRDIPIIMLTARSSAIDRVIGLEVGADDYITKPFEPRELVARVRSVLRRTYTPLSPPDSATAKRAKFRGWTLDFESRRLIDATGRMVILSGNEFSLLKFFVEHPNEVLTRKQLLTLTSQPTLHGGSPKRGADVQISRLRHKLDDGGGSSTELIKTMHRQGYVLAAAVIFE